MIIDFLNRLVIYLEKIIPSCYIEDRKGKAREAATLNNI